MPAAHALAGHLLHHRPHLHELLDQPADVLRLDAAPRAIRRRREASMMSGLRRSFGVIEWMMASKRFELLLRHVHVASAPRRRRGSSSGSPSSSPILLHALELVEEVVQGHLALGHLLLGLGGLLGVELLLGLLDQARRCRPCRGCGRRCARGGTPRCASSFSPTPMNLIGLPVTVLTDRAAPPRVSESNLVRITPSSSSRSLKRLGGVDRVLAGHGVEHEVDLVRLGGLRRSGRPRSSAPRRSPGGRRCRG